MSESDYNKIFTATFKRFSDRGWDRATIKPYFLEVDGRIKTSVPKIPPITTPTDQPSSNKECMILHFQYHTYDTPKQYIRAIWNHHCQKLFEECLGIKQTIIAYSRANNIKDSVTKAKLHQAPGQEASTFYSGEIP